MKYPWVLLWLYLLPSSFMQGIYIHIFTLGTENQEVDAALGPLKPSLLQAKEALSLQPLLTQCDPGSNILVTSTGLTSGYHCLPCNTAFRMDALLQTCSDEC